MYMQYFIGYSSFSQEAPFDASVFVDIRKRLSLELVNEINEKILGLAGGHEHTSEDPSSPADEGTTGGQTPSPTPPPASAEAGSHDTIPPATEPEPRGSLLMDATACPQDIAYPTDLNLLNDAREKSEELIDALQVGLATPKPRTYRQIARKKYLQTAQKKKKTKKQIRSALRQQLQYLRRNIGSIHQLLTQHGSIPLDEKQYKYLLVIQTLYEQQQYMYDKKVHRVDDRMVSIHQPHVRPMVRGKTGADVEFGCKIQVSLVEGMAFVDELSWDAFNESSSLQASAETYKRRFGYYPKEVIADKIYCTRQNRKWLNEKNIRLRAKPLGRPSSRGHCPFL